MQHNIFKLKCLTLLVFGCCLLSLQMADAVAQSEKNELSKQLELKIVAIDMGRFHFGPVKDPTIKWLIKNVSPDPTAFVFDAYPNWEKSVDGRSFEPVFDIEPSNSSAYPGHKLTLESGGTFRGVIPGNSYFKGRISRIKLRYKLAADSVLESNELNLASAKWMHKSHTDDPDYINDRVDFSIRKINKELEATITNVSKRPVKLFFAHCDICFWLISTNFSGWYNQGAHIVPCFHDNYVTIMPGEKLSRRYNIYIPPWTKFSNFFGVFQSFWTVKLRYIYGQYDQRHLFLESNRIYFFDREFPRRFL